jgi:3-phenylpropionate/trans-cinnamate dioxygenase ferredoxin subunit
MKAVAEWIKVAQVGDLADGQAKVFEVEAQRVAICRVGQQYFAIQDLCTHDNGPLGEGELVGDLIECPRHGARFNVKSGEPVTLPAVVPVKTFPVKVTGKEVYVEI